MAKFKKYKPKQPKKEFDSSRKKQRKVIRQERNKARVVKRWEYIPNEPKQNPISSPQSVPVREKTQTEKANDTLTYIQQNPNLNSSNQLSMYIVEAIQAEAGDRTMDLEKGDHDLYTIDNSWNGNFGSIINHITLKKEFTNPEALDALQQLTDSDWGSEEQHNKALEKAASGAYAKNIAKLDDGFAIPSYLSATLERIMNSSEMWHIVADKYGLGGKDYSSYKERKSLASSQGQADWLDMHRKVDRLMALSKISGNEISKLQNMIYGYDRNNTMGSDNDEASQILDYINTLLSKYGG